MTYQIDSAGLIRLLPKSARPYITLEQRLLSTVRRAPRQAPRSRPNWPVSILVAR